MDALSIAYLKAGRLGDAERASSQALRTGTRDARILWHAAEIAFAQGNVQKASAALDRIPSTKTGDILVEAGITELRRRFNRSSQLQ
jgi:Flp pilus assembly protein TadD